MRGRVLEDEGIPAAGERDTAWRNVLSTLRRLESDEVPGARVRLRVAGATQDVVTDAEGYFDTWIAPSEALPADTLWHDVALELLAPLDPAKPSPAAVGRVLVPPATAKLGIISDLDDTVVQTGATDVRATLRSVFLSNARTRLPFPGVAMLYRALQEGVDGRESNPVFYVSSSPWNLYDVLSEFLALREIPEGPIMLRDWGLSRAGAASDLARVAQARCHQEHCRAVPDAPVPAHWRFGSGGSGNLPGGRGAVSLTYPGDLHPQRHA